MRFSLLTLFCLNIVFVLFPVISPDRDPTGVNSWFFNEVTLYGQLLSSVLTPLLVAGTIVVALFDGRRKPISAQLLFPAFVICLLMALSAAFAETVRFETLVMALFFLLFNVYLSLMKSQPQAADTLVQLFKAYFIVWMMAPVGLMLVDPSTFDMFFTLTTIDVSYHGLANSRVGYGLWISVFILLMGKPRSGIQWFLLVVAVLTLLLSQSRAAIFGLLLSYAYGFLRDRDVRKPALPKLILLAIVCLAPLFLWAMFGRDDALTFLSEDRGIILSRFFDFIERNWLLGFGGMYLVDIPEIGKIDVPAHNYLIQTVANYGVLALGAFLVYFVCIFRFVKSSRARMLLIFLFVYSMNQPVQGTGNFFNPITLVFFLLTLAVENLHRRRARSALGGTLGHPHGVQNWPGPHQIEPA
jgi:hypothetical protein